MNLIRLNIKKERLKGQLEEFAEAIDTTCQCLQQVLDHALERAGEEHLEKYQGASPIEFKPTLASNMDALRRMWSYTSDAVVVDYVDRTIQRPQ